MAHAIEPRDFEESPVVQLAGHDRTRIDVDDAADVRYSIAPEVAGASRLRVGTSDDAFRALEEAEASAATQHAGEEAEAAQRALLSDPFPRGPRR